VVLPPKSYDPKQPEGRRIVKKPSTPEPVQAQSEQPAKVEEPKAVETSVEESATLSPQMAALARKEAKYRQELSELNKQKSQLEAERKEIEELKSLKEKLQKKDYSGLKDFVSYEEYTNYLLSEQQNADPAQQAIQNLKAEVEALKNSQQSDIEKRFEEAVNHRRSSVKQIVASNPDFVTIKELGQEEAVVQHILDTFEQDSVELTPEEAAKEVEEILLEQAKQWLSLSKVKPKEEPKVEAPKTEAPKVKTLTNSMQAMGEIKRIPKPLHQITNDAERWREARLRIRDKALQNGKS
jgi:hypothetical protein